MKALVFIWLIVMSFAAAQTPPDTFTPKPASPTFSLSFPRDHGSHPDFQTEWWYITGQLFEEGADPFRAQPLYGFQLTFFRRNDGMGSAEYNQSYLAHAAITDLNKKSFFHAKRMSAGDLGIAGAASNNLDVWNAGWTLQAVGKNLFLSFEPTTGTSIRLIASPSVAPVLNGKAGFSRKGACETCASHYYSLPRLKISGHVETELGRILVSGLAWMDHEFMSNALSQNQSGWDWISLSFADGTDLMVFQIRDKNGKRERAYGTIAREGKVSQIEDEDIKLIPTKTWTSAETQASYPTQWQVKIPRYAIDTTLSASVDSQEIPNHGNVGGPSYWEGAIRSNSGDALGYLEMTGYEKPLEASF